MRHTEPSVVVTLSRSPKVMSAEGLRRAANDNALKRKAEASGVIEIVAYCIDSMAVILFVAWVVNEIARTWA